MSVIGAFESGWGTIHCRNCYLRLSRQIPLDDLIKIWNTRDGNIEIVRREQLEMMLEWRNRLKGLTSDEIDIAMDAFDAIQPGWIINETGRKTIAKHVKKFGLKVVLDAVDVAAEQYIELNKDGKATADSADLAFHKLGGICRLSSQPDWKRELYYIRGIMRNRFSYMDHYDAIRFMEYAYADGVPLDELREIACTSRNWTKWVSGIVAARDRRVRKL